VTMATTPNVLDLLASLVRARSVASGEGALARDAADLLAGAGFEVRTPGWAAGREQLVARSGSASAPLTLTGHVDTVPADPTQWSADPWGAERDGDRMVGRGTSDMKSGVAALLVAAVEHARRPHDCRGVQVVLTAGEETGCTGALELRREDLALGGPLLVAEPTANRLVPGHKGAHWMRLSATGRAAHGSAPELGDNAVVRLARSAVALHDFSDWPSAESFGPVTANVGMLTGGLQPNIVPDSAELLLDVRTVPGVDPQTLRATVARLAGERVTVDDHVVLPVVDTPVDDPFVGLVRQALTTAGQDAEPRPPARFFTDASVLAGLLGGDDSDGGGTPVPTVILGPGEPDQCHVVDEWCSTSRVEAAVDVYSALLESWCAGRR
jgi:succinyl-diaminopimelate desuccinylase